MPFILAENYIDWSLLKIALQSFVSTVPRAKIDVKDRNLEFWFKEKFRLVVISYQNTHFHCENTVNQFTV